MAEALRSRRSAAGLVVPVGLAVNALAALALGGLSLLGEAPPLRGLIWPGALALTVAYALPAVLGLVALAGRRPAALLAAGLVGLPLAFTALSGISLLLVAPAVLYLIGYLRWHSRPPLAAGAAVALVVVVAAGVAALVLLFASPVGRPAGYCYTWTQDPAGRRTYGPARPVTLAGAGEEGSGSGLPAAAAGGSGCTSDIVTAAKAALGLSAAAVAVTVSLRLPVAVSGMGGSPD